MININAGCVENKYMEVNKRNQPKKIYFKKWRLPVSKSTFFICRRRGHWENKCPKKNKFHLHSKLVALFSTKNNPTQWDSCSEPCSDQECISIFYSSKETEFIPQANHVSLLHELSPSSNSSNSFVDILEIEFLSIKMFSFVPHEFDLQKVIDGCHK